MSSKPVNISLAVADTLREQQQAEQAALEATNRHLADEQAAILATNEQLSLEQKAIRETNAHLVAEQTLIRKTSTCLLAEQETVRQTNADLIEEQKLIQATNAHLIADQRALKAYNELLLREQVWLKKKIDDIAQGKTEPGNPVRDNPPRFKVATGMMSPIDMEAVRDLAAQVPVGGTIVDVGSLLGLSASLWCNYSDAGRIVCIDPWQYETWLESFRDHNGPITMEAFLANVPDERIETIKGYSPACGAGWSDPIDLYWEDGDHINPGCGESIRFWSEFVKPGGIACGHDCHLPDVIDEAATLAYRWGAELKMQGSVWSVRRPL